MGEITKLMSRGQITIPAKYRKRLGLTPDTPLNVFEYRGMVVIMPVRVEPNGLAFSARERSDWFEDLPERYMEKVRYNPLEKLWVEVARTR